MATGHRPMQINFDACQYFVLFKEVINNNRLIDCSVNRIFFVAIRDRLEQQTTTHCPGQVAVSFGVARLLHE